MAVTDSQWRFLRSQFLASSMLAAFARASIYGNNVSSADRLSVQQTVLKTLEQIAEEYSQPVGETRHLENIERLASALETNHALALREGKFRIGPAQKALNVYLKYLWCADKIPPPPHCPVDARILGLAAMRDVAWTQITSLDQYMSCIGALRKEADAKGQSLSDWECDQWSKAK